MHSRWATEPHIRFGDPCHDCARPMAPASRSWSRWTLPAGVLKHAGRGLCGTCRRRRRAAGTLDLDVVEAADAT